MQKSWTYDGSMCCRTILEPAPAGPADQRPEPEQPGRTEPVLEQVGTGRS